MTCEDAELASVRQELLDRGDEVVTFRQLVERFGEVDEFFGGDPWNLKQIYNNFNILIGEKPCKDCVSRQAVLDKQVYTETSDGWTGWTVDVNDIEELQPVIPQQKMRHCKWIKYDHRTICPKDHDIDNPYWRIPENRKEVLKYCPYCGLEVEIDGV